MKILVFVICVETIIYLLYNLHDYTFNFILEICFIPSFGILELRNRVTQNDVTLQVTNSEIFIEALLSCY